MREALQAGTHCPANKAADMIGDRWVLQIVRAMMMGATRFGDLKQAVPRISPTMLSQRLKQMTEQGIIVRRERQGAKGAAYRLTPSGRELEPIVRHLATWGLRWAERNIKDSEIDIGALMWDVHKSLRTHELPDGETVFSIALSGVENFAKWWIVANGRQVDLCSDNPGKDVDVYMNCSIETLVGIWQGQKSVREAMASDELMLDGPPDLLRTAENWMPLSPVAGVRS